LFFVLELGVRFFAFQGCCDRVRDGWPLGRMTLLRDGTDERWQVMTALALATPVDQAEATFIRRGAQWLNTAPDSKG
ncbi:unnamed protein product, partial [Durusdinium trenchii]